MWVTVALACAVMVPLTEGRARRWAFAMVNIGFLAFHLRAGVVALLGGIGLIYLVLRLVEAGRGAAALLWSAGGAILFLFVVHKLPALGAELGLRRWNPLLSVIGFSYVALRLVEVGRAVGEGRHRAPGAAALVNYLLPFHMLAAGPIQSYDDFVAQPEAPPPADIGAALRSVERIVMGLFKKFVLATPLEAVFLTGFRAPWPYFLLELQINYIWIFLDFSAYTDIAVGIGGLLGVATPENFNRPYLARSSIDYWDRWHMSLSQFIRRNLFIPIQLTLVRRTGGRRPLIIASFAFGVSFLLCGLWHGVNRYWLAWGAYQSLGLILCNAYRDFLLKRFGRKGLNRYLSIRWIRAVAVLVTFEFIAFSLVIVTYPWRFPTLTSLSQSWIWPGTP
jgi:D-alanyl-lipoteichoic acid acyltransferase DltB (MBOAT superfamily)